MLRENLQAALHQHDINGNVAGREAQFGYAGFFSDRDPDFGHQHSLHVQRYDALFHAGEVLPKSLCVVQRTKLLTVE